MRQGYDRNSPMVDNMSTTLSSVLLHSPLQLSTISNNTKITSLSKIVSYYSKHLLIKYNHGYCRDVSTTLR